MGKVYQRVQRGMVFWFDPSKVYGEPTEFVGYNGRTYKSSIQNGKRPWLVVSNDEGNASSPTCNIVPITLEDKTSIPVHVYFQYEGKRQTILCEQPKTVDIMALGEYMYTVSDELMIEVERAQQIQYHIRAAVSYTDFNLDNTLKHLEAIVSHIIQEKSKNMQPNQSQIPVSAIEDTAIQLGQMIEDLVGTSQPITEQLKQEVKPEKKSELTPAPVKPATKPQKPNYSGMSAVEKFNAKYNRTSAKQQETKLEPKKITTTKPKRNTWTPESRQAYLDDCEKLSPQEVMIKYGFTTINSVFQTKYACKNALGKSI